MARNVTSLAIGVALALASPVLSQSRVFHLGGESAGDLFGFAQNVIGDVDGDGVSDFVVGAPNHDGVGVDSGMARVYSGRTGTALYDLLGDAAQDLFGYGFADLGDVDGDGVPDFAVGAPQLFAGPPARGYARIFSGRTGRALHTIIGERDHALLGFALRGIGDADGDGAGDLLVGAPGVGHASAHLVSGRTGLTLRIWRGDPAGGDQFGFAVAPAGDFDGDGSPDVVIGAPADGSAAPFAGLVRVYSARTGGELRTWRGTAAIGFFGSGVDGGADLDGDGAPDVVVGAYGANAFAGAAWVFSARTGAVLHAVTGNQPDEFFGVVVRLVGDLDADGRADFAVGTHAEYTRLFTGRTGRVLATLRGRYQHQHAHFGLNPAPAGDLDGDGFAELIVGAHTETPGLVESGSSYVFSGRDLPLTTDTHLLSAAAGGAQVFALAAGANHAGRIYLLVGSFSGTRPGLDLGGVRLPLNLDGYLLFLAAHPNQWIAGSAGLLDGSGTGSARLAVPAGALTELVGAVVHHAFVVLDATQFFAVSNAVSLAVVR